MDLVLPVGPVPDLSALSRRERQGRAGVDVAAALCVSLATVKAHVAHLRDKLGARDRVQPALPARAGGAGCPQAGAVTH